MTEYFLMTRGHPYWNETIALAERCSWRAGRFLARKMRDNDFLDWEYDKLYIMSGETGLYEKYGFEKLGDYKTIYDTTDQLFVQSIG